jgi:hypothetical protein
MRAGLAALMRNLAAGMRLALFLRVQATAFRVTLGALLALIVFVYVFEVALEAIRVGPGATFNPFALPYAVAGTAVTLFVIGVVAVAFRQPQLMLAASVAILAAMPVLICAGTLYHAIAERFSRATPFYAWITWATWMALTAWALAIVMRALALTLVPRPRYFHAAVVAAAVAVFGATLLSDLQFPRPDWWRAAQGDEAQRASTWSVVTEQALVRQPQLLAQALDSIAPQRPGLSDLYFVGFASYASQDVFERDVRTARSVVAEAFEVADRSIVLVSNPRTVVETPIATASNLRAALNAVGARIDRDEDAVMLFLTTHGGADHRLSVEFYPLQLDAITPLMLKAMLDEAGIRFRIVVISACYSGGFIAALADDTTIVMAAAAHDRKSFGCSHDSEMTYFTDALFNQALRKQPGLLEAFDRARVLVLERERAEGLTPPSDPQIHVGASMRAKLADLERRASRPTCAASGC